MLQGRVVVVTGAGGGIGRSIAERFLANGDYVLALDRSMTALDSLLSRLLSKTLSTICADITSASDLDRVVAWLQEAHGCVDILVNCAGYYPVVPFEQMDLAQWQEVIAINLTGTFQMTKAILPLMKDRGWGRIINISSASLFEGVPGQTHYVAAKAGIIGFTRSLAMEVGEYGVTVNAVAPGLTLTEPVLRDMPEELIKAQPTLRSIKRDEHPQDLAGPVFLLSSPDADFRLRTAARRRRRQNQTLNHQQVMALLPLKEDSTWH